LAASRKVWIAVTVVLMTLAALLEAISYSLIAPLIQTFVLNQKLQPPVDSLGVMGFYERLLASSTPVQRLQWISAGILGISILKHVVLYASQVVSTWLWLRIGTDLRQRMWQKCLQLDYAYFLSRKQGSIVHDVLVETHHTAYVLQLLVNQVGNLLNLLTLVGLLFAISWEVTVLILLPGALIWAIVHRISNRVRLAGEQRIGIEEEAMALVTEAVAGIRQVKVFSAENQIVESFGQVMRRFLDNRVLQDVLTPIPFHATHLLSISVLCLFLFGFSILYASKLLVLLPALGTSLIIFRSLIPHISSSLSTWIRLQSFFPSVGTVCRFLKETDRADLPQMSGSPIQDGPMCSEVYR
jgi:ABC-type multidrug transport system fused ATPase/permease subunit